MRDDAESAVQFFTSALDLLQWGNERFRNVSFEDKGAVFQPTFIRGVKCLRLDAFIKVRYRVLRFQMELMSVL